MGDSSFEHEGEINTTPAHDLAHLLVSIGGRLPWEPRGQHVKLAEFNAVLLEVLLSACVDSVLRAAPIDARAQIEHARWFVQEHYAPFPCPLEDALRLFGEGLDVNAVIRLFPIFWALRRRELVTPAFREDEHRLVFHAGDSPVVAPGKATQARDRVASLLSWIVARARAGRLTGEAHTPRHGRWAWTPRSPLG